MPIVVIIAIAFVRSSKARWGSTRGALSARNRSDLGARRALGAESRKATGGALGCVLGHQPAVVVALLARGGRRGAHHVKSVDWQ